jgi:AcrR family transcriptional regulator
MFSGMPEPVNAHVAASRQTRAELLEAGLQLLSTKPATAALGHLTVASITAEAGRTSGAFFHQWPTLDAYLHDLIGYVLRPEHSVNLWQTVERLSAGLAGGATFARSLAEAGRDVPERSAHDPQTIIELLMWNRALHDESFRAVVAGHYARLDAGAAPAYGELMRLLGRAPRPPFSAESIGAICTAIAQGLALRASLTPGLYPERTFGWLVATLVPLLTTTAGDDRDAGAFVDDLPLEVVAPPAGG